MTPELEIPKIAAETAQETRGAGGKPGGGVLPEFSLGTPENNLETATAFSIFLRRRGRKRRIADQEPSEPLL